MLRQDVDQYVALRRVLGYKFDQQHRSLKQFADYATTHGDELLRVDRVLAWAAAKTTSSQWRQTLVARVRQFALAVHAENPLHEVPPQGCVGHGRTARRSPYIYSAEDVERLMRAAQQLRANSSIRPATLIALMGLLASTGLRISEALSLRCCDIREDGLIIHKSKNGKSRLIPLDETVRAELEKHLTARARQTVYTEALFVTRRGQALLYHVALWAFRQTLARAGLSAPSNNRPRIHDFRHTFAVRSLEHCPSDRQAVAQHMLALSTYLGHAHVTDTYWYLEATPIIMRGIAAAGEAMYRGGGE